MKKLTLSAIALAAALTGCQNSEVVNEINGTTDYHTSESIGFTSNTTRAAALDLTYLQGLTGGFTVYGHTKDASSWYGEGGVTIDGATSKYKWNTSFWVWADQTGAQEAKAPKWPAEDAATYPMTFFAANQTAAIEVTGTAAPGDVTKEIVISGAPADQKDLMAAWGQANEIPETGKIALNFKHILSKVNIGASIDAGYGVEIISAEFHNVRNNRNYDYAVSNTTTELGWDPWSAWSSTNLLDVPYLTTSATAATITGASAGTQLVGADGNMMLIPQSLIGALSADPAKSTTFANYSTDHSMVESTALTQPTSTAGSDRGAISAGAYITLIYRMYKDDGTTKTDIDKLGMADYEDHPYIVDATKRPNGFITSGLPTGATPLYIKVFIPITYDSWEAGKGYKFVAALGTDGAGSYFDDTYYDNKGGDTNLPITSDKGTGISPVDPNEPVTVKYIHFTVTATDWDGEESM